MKINVFHRNSIRDIRIYNSFQKKWGDILKIILRKYNLSIEELNTIIIRNNQTNNEINMTDLNFNQFIIDHEVSFNISSYVFILCEFRLQENREIFNKKYIDYLMLRRNNPTTQLPSQEINPFSLFGNNVSSTHLPIPTLNPLTTTAPTTTSTSTAPTTTTPPITANTETSNTPRILTRTYTFFPGMEGLPNANNNNWTDLTNNLLSLFNLPPTLPQSLLSEEEINQLPHGLYSDIKRDNEPHTQCSISLREFEETSNVMRLPCEHLFMEDSIRQWLRTSNKCPLCRTEINSSSN